MREAGARSVPVHPRPRAAGLRVRASRASASQEPDSPVTASMAAPTLERCWPERAWPETEAREPRSPVGSPEEEASPGPRSPAQGRSGEVRRARRSRVPGSGASRSQAARSRAPDWRAAERRAARSRARGSQAVPPELPAAETAAAEPARGRASAPLLSRPLRSHCGHGARAEPSHRPLPQRAGGDHPPGSRDARSRARLPRRREGHRRGSAIRDRRCVRHEASGTSRRRRGTRW